MCKYREDVQKHLVSVTKLYPKLYTDSMDFTKFMNKFNEVERSLSPTSSLRLNFDNISPETEEPEENKRIWGVPVPPFVSEKVVSWIEEEFNEPPIYYNGNAVIRKVRKGIFLICLNA